MVKNNKSENSLLIILVIILFIVVIFFVYLNKILISRESEKSNNSDFLVMVNDLEKEVNDIEKKLDLDLFESEKFKSFRENKYNKLKLEEFLIGKDNPFSPI